MSDNQFDSRAWSNGELCPTHGIPYCSPCLRAKLGADVPKPARDTEDDYMARMRDEVIRRIRTGEYKHSQFHRPVQRNFFAVAPCKKFAASCPIGDSYLVVTLDFIMMCDDTKAWKANEEESRFILRGEHRWDEATPAWAQNFVPDISEEDSMLLREMQLFK